MKHLSFFVLILLASVSALAQRFRPYHSFGVEMSFATSVSSTDRLLVDGANYPKFYPIGESIRTLDVYGHYDYGVTRWFGLSSGLGLVCRGGQNQNQLINDPNLEPDKRLFFYASVPLTVQLKPFKSFWLEGGLSSNFFLFKDDQGYFLSDESTNDVPGHFKDASIKSVVLNWHAGFRFNLYRGLSLGADYYASLTPIAQEASPYDANYVSTFDNRGFRLGLRYMFGQGQ